MNSAAFIFIQGLTRITVAAHGLSESVDQCLLFGVKRHCGASLVAALQFLMVSLLP